jgi:hypothetical protein
MKMEYVSEILRGWPNGSALERSELITQGAILVNGNVVAMQPDGTVNLSGSSTSRKVGLVIRGNGDSASALNADGIFMTPQPAKAITALTWSAGALTATVTAHGYALGNIVVLGGTITDANSVSITGSYVVATVIDANNFTVALASNPGAITNTSGIATLGALANNSGKAIVLWGNYIVATSNFAAGAYVPGSPVTALNGQFSLANGTTDPEVGFVLQVQGASATQTNHLNIVVY